MWTRSLLPLLPVGALLLAGCSHAERGGPNAEDVPPPVAVQQNAIPNDMPPATPPIPKTAASAAASEPATTKGVEVNPNPRRGRTAKAPRPPPLPPGQPVEAPEPVPPGH